MEFKNGDRLRMVRGCCGLNAGDLGTYRNGRFEADRIGYSHDVEGFDGMFELDKPRLEVGKTYRLTGEPKSAAGYEAFVGVRPKPTQVSVVRLPSSSSENAYVSSADGLHQWVDVKLLGDEVTEEEAPKASTLSVGDRVRIVPEVGRDRDRQLHLNDRQGTITEMILPGSLVDELCYRVQWTRPNSGTNLVYAGKVQKAVETEFTPEIGKDYILLPDARIRPGDTTVNVHFKPDVTRVQVVSDMGAYEGPYRVRALNGGDTDVTISDNRWMGRGETQAVHKSFLAPLGDETSTEVDPKDAEIQRLKDALRAARNDVEAVRAQHRADVEHIGEKFISEADDRGWCSEYDTFVRDEVNPGLTVELPTREREYSVTFTFTQTISVTALSEDDAVEAARESSDYKSDSYGDLSEDDYEVEED